MTCIEHLDDKFDFGKFSGCTFAEVLEYNPEYITWVVQNVNGSMCIFCDSVVEELQLLFPKFEITHRFEIMRNHRIVEFEEAKDCQEKDYYYGRQCNDDYEDSSFGRYAGSYAQDEMGYSDDDIDTIFDGDPDAYWNID
ncbi:hypothetical protein [Sodaliphilus sp.]|uniref:exodeoxyribonuclease X C-terminal domain-containing protein n=1 Tax=Sodaliphilus sp. TaxID=2815818 RepID=UPI00388D1892